MKYFIIAGEASGDLHGANLTKHLFIKDPKAQILAWGGDKMQQAGATIKKHIKNLAFMGFIEVLFNLKTILKNFKQCKKQINEFNPNIIVLIDYPGFNLSISAWAKKNGYKVVYYISPQVWAWKKNRVKKIKKYVDQMYVILPFEEDFYKKYGVNVKYIGHPLIDTIENFKKEYKQQNIIADNKPILALFPGSRKQEVKKMLPIMLMASDAFANTHKIVISAVGLLPMEIYELNNRNIELITDQAYPIMMQAECAFVKSGTSTLEAAIFNLPLVVCYKANPISYFIAKCFVARNINYISLVNLIAGKEICRELIQNELTPENMIGEMKKLLPNSNGREKMLESFKKLQEQLGEGRVAERIADGIIEFCN